MAKLNLSPQQIRSIKQSPKGQLPKFIIDSTPASRFGDRNRTKAVMDLAPEIERRAAIKRQKPTPINWGLRDRA